MSDSAVADLRAADLRAAATPRSLAWFSGLLALALMALRWPYRGVRHDAILYLGQALMHRDPAWARTDLYFAYGSQDQYTIFGRVMAAAIGALGVERAEILGLVLAAALSLAAILLLARYLPAPSRWLAPVVVIGLSHFYGSQRIFSYLEPFLTARSWAEPLSLLALVLLLRGRLALALPTWLLAAACHPLLAVPTALIGWAWLILQDRRWKWLGLLAVPVIGLAAAGVAPFSALLVCYDDTWFHVTIVSNPGIFLSMWTPTELAAAAGAVALLWWAARALSGPLADLCRATAVVTAILCAVSFVGGDFWHDVLITQLQLWRVLWIAMLLATLVLPYLVSLLLAQGAPGRLAAAALVLAVLANDTSLSSGWALVLWAVLAVVLVREGRLDAVKPRVLNLATGGMVAAAVMLTLTQAFNVWSQLQMHKQGMAIGRPAWLPATLPLLLVTVALVLVGWQARGGWRSRLAQGLLAVLLVAGIAGWDQRSAWNRYLERTPPGTHPFAAFIPKDAQVVWDRDLLPTWLLLQRPSYFATGQASGALFNRGTAMAIVQRFGRASAFVLPEANCEKLEWLGFAGHDLQDCEFPRKAFLDLCDPHLPGRAADFVIAPQDVGVPSVARWRFDPADGEAPTTWWLYDCKQVQAAMPAMPPTPAPGPAKPSPAAQSVTRPAA